MINIYTIFEARWLAAGHALKQDGYTAGDFENMNLELFGGCGCCQASLSALNAYPDRKTGYWACRECVYDPCKTVEEFEAWCKADNEARKIIFEADVAEQEAHEKADREMQYHEWTTKGRPY